MYHLLYRRSVDKDLRSIQPRARRAIIKHIEALADQPRPKGSVKLKGSRDLFRIRYQQYRVIYQINDQQITVLIIKVGHRREVYSKI